MNHASDEENLKSHPKENLMTTINIQIKVGPAKELLGFFVDQCTQN